ncbi:MAG: zinc-ribbon and DUF3426 domain-containing protein [Burkholderiales bacterium]
MSAPLTRCPTCGTTFRALPSQLSVRGGMVRCGKCAAVFDGVANLVEESAAAEAAEPSPQLGLFEAGALGAPRPAPRPLAPAEDEPLPEFLDEEPPRSRYGVAWGLGALIAAMALAGQLVYQYRTELATLAPRLQPLLAEGCRVLDCELRLPRRPDLLSIESSDLQSDARRESLIVLNAVIRNRAAFAQELPALELTLTDAADRPLVRRVLRPADYAQGLAAALQGPGLAPGAEAVLRLHFDSGGVRATGYRLYLFYPA